MFGMCGLQELQRELGRRPGPLFLSCVQQPVKDQVRGLVPRAPGQ